MRRVLLVGVGSLSLLVLALAGPGCGRKGAADGGYCDKGDHWETAEGQTVTRVTGSCAGQQCSIGCGCALEQDGQGHCLCTGGIPPSGEAACIHPTCGVLFCDAPCTCTNPGQSVCDCPVHSDAGTDAGTDGGADAGADAGEDGGADAGIPSNRLCLDQGTWRYQDGGAAPQSGTCGSGTCSVGCFCTTDNLSNPHCYCTGAIPPDAGQQCIEPNCGVIDCDSPCSCNDPQTSTCGC